MATIKTYLTVARLFSATLIAALGGCATPPARFQLTEHVPSQSQIENLSNGLGAAPLYPARALMPSTIALIKDFEGWNAVAYDDPNYCTIGYGHLIALRRCSQIRDNPYALRSLSQHEGDALLEKDTQTARLAVQQLVSASLTDDQFGALSSLVFNIGQKNFAGSTIRLLLNAKDFKGAVYEFQRWRKSKGRVLDGLIHRRSCEAALFQSQIRLEKNGSFNREQCRSLGAAPMYGESIDIEIGERK